MTRKQAAFLGAFLIGFVSASGAMAKQQRVTLPVPAPKAKTGVTTGAAAGTGTRSVMPPPPSAAASFKPPMKLAANATASAASGVPVPVKPEIIGNNRPNGGPPFDAQQKALAERVSLYLTGIRTLVGDFVQVGPDGSKTQGQIYLQKPGRVRFEYEDPSPIQLISDGQSVVVRDRKLATQDLYPLSQTPLRFLLADKLDLLRDTNVVGIFSDDIFSTIVIEEKQAIGGTHRLMLMFSAQDLTLKQWTVTDPQGYDTTVAVYNLDTNKKPDPGLFKINYERVLQ